MFITAPTDNISSTKDWPRHPADLLDQYITAPAANVGDVFDRLLVLDSGIRCLTSHTRLVGTALPILTRAGDNLAIHYALDDAQPGDVLVINGQGDLSRALIGDLIGEIMVAKGVLGAIVDGVIRDAETLSRQGLAVFARGTTPAGPYKNGPGIIGNPVAVGGVVDLRRRHHRRRRRRHRHHPRRPRNQPPRNASSRSSPKKRSCDSGSSHPPADRPALAQ